MVYPVFLVFGGLWDPGLSPGAMGLVCGCSGGVRAASFRVQLCQQPKSGISCYFPKRPGLGGPPFGAVPPYFRGLDLRAQRESDKVPDM